MAGTASALPRSLFPFPLQSTSAQLPAVSTCIFFFLPKAFCLLQPALLLVQQARCARELTLCRSTGNRLPAMTRAALNHWSSGGIIFQGCAVHWFTKSHSSNLPHGAHLTEFPFLSHFITDAFYNHLQYYLLSFKPLSQEMFWGICMRKKQILQLQLQYFILVISVQ